MKDMLVITEKLITYSENIKTKNDLFKTIASLIVDSKRSENPDKIVQDLENREKEGGTAFENGLMIPHARTKWVKEITLVVVGFNDCNFESIDGKLTNIAVAILVPEKQGAEHLKILSKISTLFSDLEKFDKFKKATKEEKVKIINETISKEEQQIDHTIESYDIIGVTSCAAGIAHTYMARDSLIKAAKEMGKTIKIETRGAMTENKLTASDIENAKFVIIAADVTVSKKPFEGKKIYETDTNSAIKNAKKCIENMELVEVYKTNGKQTRLVKSGIKTRKNILGKAIMSALSFMIPVTVAGGILMAIPNAMAAGGNDKGGTWKFPNSFVEALWQFGHIGLLMMVPILSMFLAYKLAGKSAIPAALIGGYFINDGTMMSKYSLIKIPAELVGQASAGFLGGLVVGIIVGYMVRFSKCIKWHPWLKPISGLMIIPIFSSFIIFLIITYIIGGPVTWLMSELFKGLEKLNDIGGIWASLGVGMLFSILMGIDLGGPINKTALTVATVIFTSTMQQGHTNFTPQTAVQAAISVPPLGMWLATIIFRKKFALEELAAGAAALPMGLVGVTEGALPFAFKTPLRAIFANIVGCAVAGSLVSVMSIQFYGGLGSPLGAYVGYMQHSFYGLEWIASVLIGVVVTAFLYGFMRKRNLENEKEIKENKIKKLEEYKKIGLNTKKEIRKFKNANFRKNFKKRFVYMVNPKNWFAKPDDWNEEEQV